MKDKLRDIIVGKMVSDRNDSFEVGFNEILENILSDNINFKVSYINEHLCIVLMDSCGQFKYPLFHIANSKELNITQGDIDSYLKSYKRTFKIDRILDI